MSQAVGLKAIGACLRELQSPRPYITFHIQKSIQAFWIAGSEENCPAPGVHAARKSYETRQLLSVILVNFVLGMISWRRLELDRFAKKPNDIGTAPLNQVSRDSGAEGSKHESLWPLPTFHPITNPITRNTPTADD
jgi:hypothetical protein